MPQVKVATVYFTPARRQFLVGPDYWLHEVEQPPVFPHELGAMNPEAVQAVDPGLHAALWGEAEEASA